MHDDTSRLTSATGANPLTTVTYNGHGDATALDAQTITYDGTDRVTAMATSGGGTTDAWEGEYQRGYEHTGGLNATLMGALLYQAAWGQFASLDPFRVAMRTRILTRTIR